MPEAHLVERLVDKVAFQELAAHLGLPVPPAQALDLSVSLPDVKSLSYPVLIKPLRRDGDWGGVTQAKAVMVARPEELAELLDVLATTRSTVLAQRPIPGPETNIESYHAYVDSSGDVAVQFTGRKVRTYPSAMGHSTALVTTDSADVADLGRGVIRTLGLRGVAKLDFKRDCEGRLWLLEVNPRFSLWHHLGAAAGVNIPAVVWADLVGEPRPPLVPPRAGVRWCRVQRDLLAARQEGISLLSWLRWVMTCDIKAGLDLRDPVPLAASTIVAPVYEGVRRRLGGR